MGNQVLVRMSDEECAWLKSKAEAVEVPTTPARYLRHMIQEAMKRESKKLGVRAV